MNNKFQLTALALIIGGVALSGCAAKKTWSPELEQAQKSYAKAAANPLVASYAVTELQQAKAQLDTAQNASDFYKSRAVIAHEATLAQLKTLEAEQTARALQAKESIRLVQAGAPIQQLIPDASQRNNFEPIVAAATPAYSNENDFPTSLTGNSLEAKSMKGGSHNTIQQLHQELAYLQSQITQLQDQSAIGTSAAISSFESSWASGKPVSLNAIQVDSGTEVYEPVLAAANPAPSSPLSLLETDKSIHDVYHETYGDAPVQDNIEISQQIFTPETQRRARLSTGRPVDLGTVDDEPVLAAATPASSATSSSLPQSDGSIHDVYHETYGDNTALVTYAEVVTSETLDYQIDTTLADQPVAALPDLTAEISNPLQEIQLNPVQDSTELQLAAALPAASLDGDNSVLETYAPSQRAGNAPAVESDAKLREQLRAINARPFSDGGLALTLGERYFEAGSAKLWESRAARHLDNIASVMVEHGDLVIDIEAHTDSENSKEQSDKLTTDRAIAMKTALVIRGVDGSRINTTGFGSSDPVADNNSAVGRLKNRRIEIIFPNITQL